MMVANKIIPNTHNNFLLTVAHGVMPFPTPPPFAYPRTRTRTRSTLGTEENRYKRGEVLDSTSAGIDPEAWQTDELCHLYGL